MASDQTGSRPLIGWREWVALPDLGIDRIKAKVDTGARTSSLHASAVEEFDKDGVTWVRFDVHPLQRSKGRRVSTAAAVLEYRSVRSSSGAASIRPVILTRITLLGITYEVELTLAQRDQMGFRMLLGREAFRRRFLVDAGNSFYGDKPPRSPRNTKQKSKA